MQGHQAMKLKETFNFYDGYLVNAISGTDNMLVVSDAGGLDPSGGVIIIDNVDPYGTSTPSNREFISYKSVKNGKLVGVKRGTNGSMQQAHATGARIQAIPLIEQIKEDEDLELADYLEQLL